MTPLSEIPKLPDGSVLPLLTGTVKKIEETKIGVKKNGKPWKKQAWLIEAPSGSIYIDTFIQALFVQPEDIGKLITWYSTPTDQGFMGATKTSYIDKDGQKRHNISLMAGSSLTPKGEPVNPTTKATPKPTTPVMQPAPKIPASMQRSYSSDIEKLAKQWQCCWLAAVDHAPKEWTDVLRKDFATTLFIEGQRKGLRFAPPMNHDTLPTQGETKQPEPPKPEPPKPEPQAPASSPPSTPKRSDESLATKIYMGDHFTADDLKGHNLEKVFDTLYKEAKNDCSTEFLDAEYDEVKKRSGGDEQKTYSRIILNWSKYLQAAKNRGIVEPEVE